MRGAWFRVVGALARAGGGGGQTLQARRVRITSGNVAGTNTAGAWVVVDNGTDEFSVACPAVVGDLVMVSPRFMSNPGTIKLDIAALASGVPIEYSSSGTNTPDVDGEAWSYQDPTFLKVPNPVEFVVTAPMIVGGEVTFALMRRGTSASGLIYGDTNYSFKMWALNLGQVSMS